MESVFTIAALGASAFSAGIFLRARHFPLWASTLISALGGLLQLALPHIGAWVGLLFATVLLAFSKHTKIKGAWVFICISASAYKLCLLFHDSLLTLMEAGVALWAFNAFFIALLPAVLLTFPSFCLPNGWQGENKYIVPMLASLLPAIAYGCTPFLISTNTASIITTFLVCLSFFSLVLLLMYLITAYMQKQEQCTIESGYHSEMNTFMNIVRSQRHDYNLHVQTVAGLIAAEKWDECRSYVNALKEDTIGVNVLMPVQDPAIAALIGNYKTLATQQGSVLRVDVRDDLSSITTSIYETNKIIGNLLQNALDETAQQKDQGNVIELDIFKRGEYCMIRVSNKLEDVQGFSRRQERIFHQGFTTKHGHDGVGLSSILTLCKHVGGDVSAWIEGDVVHFIAAVPMKCPVQGGNKK